MAPPSSRRSKQNSTSASPPPIPVPGIALGLFAAVAAGFAASRALRRKRLAKSLQDEQQSSSAGNPSFKEREMEIKERSDDSPILIHANGTITIAQEPSKLAAGSLKPLFDAIEEASLVQKTDAIPASEETEGELDGEEKGNEKDCGEEQSEEAKNGSDFEKKGDTMEKLKTNEEERETAEVIVKFEASLAVDDDFVEALQSSIVEENENDAGEDETGAGEKRTEVQDSGVIDNDEDICEDDEIGSADQQPSLVLINGKILDFFEEIEDFKDEPDLLSSGSNSLSDAVSESSMQEVSSAPVKPFVPTEETLETSRSGAKSGFFADLNQSGQEIALPELDNNWPCNESYFSEDNAPEMKKKVPDFVENLSQADFVESMSQAGEHFTGLKHDWANLNVHTLHLKAPELDVDVGLLDLKPVLVETKENQALFDNVNQIKFDLLSDVIDRKGSSIAFEDKFSIKVNELDEGIAESTTINAKVLSNGSSFLKELDDCESVGECEHIVQSTREIADDFAGLQYKGENIVETVQSNGKDVLLEEPLNDLDAMTTDKTSSQTGQKGMDATKSDSHSNLDLPAASELLSSKKCVSSENDLHDGEFAEEKVCLECDTSEQCVIVEGILEEPKPKPTVQTLDNVDGKTAENNVKLEQEQSSLLIASKGISEGTELSCEGSTDIANREDMDGGDVIVKDGVPTREQEIEVTTRSCESDDRVCEKNELTFSTDSAHVTHYSTREADDLLLKGAVHQHSLQPKGVSGSKALQYLPLGVGFMCLLIALISYISWYLEVLSAVSS